MSNILEQALSPDELDVVLDLAERGFLSSPANGYALDLDDLEGYAIEAATQAIKAVVKFSRQREALNLPPQAPDTNS